jgi:HSP20 family protein
MRITNWRGFAPRQTYSRSLDDFFNDRYRSLVGLSTDDFSPALNTRDTEESYEIELAVPGHDKDDLQVTVNDGVLTVSTIKQSNTESGEGDYMHREFSYSSFSRSFGLPKDVDDENISADYRNGILNIHLPRQKKAEENEAVRSIAIQ